MEPQGCLVSYSLAGYVRRLVPNVLSESVPSADKSIVFDLGSSGGSDIATAKDRMIGEAIAARKSGSSKKIDNSCA